MIVYVASWWACLSGVGVSVASWWACLSGVGVSVASWWVCLLAVSYVSIGGGWVRQTVEYVCVFFGGRACLFKGWVCLQR